MPKGGFTAFFCSFAFCVCPASVLLLGLHDAHLAGGDFIDGGFDRLLGDDDAAILGLRRNLPRSFGGGDHQRIAAFMVGSQFIDRGIQHIYTTFPSV